MQIKAVKLTFMKNHGVALYYKAFSVEKQNRQKQNSIKLVSPKNGINESGKLLMALNLNLKNVFLAGSMMK